MAEKVAEKRHARLGPSSSDIWLTCLGAPGEWAKYPDRPVGFAAREGTLAHTLCEAAIRIQDIPWKEDLSFDVEGTTVPITNEMLNAVSLYARAVSVIQDIAQWSIVEKEVSFGWLWDQPPAELFGTADFAGCDKVTLYVLDFKYGRGKAVTVERNTQLLCYALGAYGKLLEERPDLAETIESVSLVIVQPRAGGTPVRQWTISIAELLYWGYGTLKPSIDKILSGKPQPLTPGNHCYFCNASSECPAYRKLKVRRTIDSFPDLLPDEIPS